MDRARRCPGQSVCAWSRRLRSRVSSPRFTSAMKPACRRPVRRLSARALPASSAATSLFAPGQQGKPRSIQPVRKPCIAAYLAPECNGLAVGSDYLNGAPSYGCSAPAQFLALEERAWWPSLPGIAQRKRPGPNAEMPCASLPDQCTPFPECVRLKCDLRLAVSNHCQRRLARAKASPACPRRARFGSAGRRLNRQAFSAAGCMIARFSDLGQGQRCLTLPPACSGPRLVERQTGYSRGNTGQLLSPRHQRRELVSRPKAIADISRAAARSPIAL